MKWTNGRSITEASRAHLTRIRRLQTFSSARFTTLPGRTLSARPSARSDLNEVDQWKVYNGSFQGTFNQDSAAPNFFFRAVYDPARQDFVSTTVSAYRSE